MNQLEEQIITFFLNTLLNTNTAERTNANISIDNSATPIFLILNVFNLLYISSTSITEICHISVSKTLLLRYILIDVTKSRCESKKVLSAMKSVGRQNCLAITSGNEQIHNLQQQDENKYIMSNSLPFIQQRWTNKRFKNLKVTLYNSTLTTKGKITMNEPTQIQYHVKQSEDSEILTQTLH